MDSDVDRAVRLGMVNIELVGSFGKPWTLQQGDKVVRGVEFEAKAIRVSNARTGKVLFISDR